MVPRVFMLLIFICMRQLMYTADEDCLPNCRCSTFTAECYLGDCANQIEHRYPKLIVYGHLCQEHFQTLNAFEGNIRIILHSTTCRTIRNCE